MARKGISFDEVCNAANAIKARGQEPTLAAVRVELGNEGSYTTIGTHLAKWKAEGAERADVRQMPQEAENEALKAIHLLWHVAVRFADADIAQIKQTAEDDLKVAQKRLAEAEAEIQRMEKREEQLGDELAATKADNTRLALENAKLEGLYEGARAKTVTDEAAIQALKEALAAVKLQGAPVPAPAPARTKPATRKQ